MKTCSIKVAFQVLDKMYDGFIKFSLKRKGEEFLSGGVIEFYPDPENPNKKSYAVFCTQGMPMNVGIALSIPCSRVQFKPIPRNKGVSCVPGLRKSANFFNFQIVIELKQVCRNSR